MSASLQSRFYACHLWQWLREDVTYHACYDKKSKLIAQVKQFEQRINLNPHQIADRLNFY